MEHGFFIAVDGGDKVGKETQVNELAKNLALDGYEVLILGIPDYSTPMGKIIDDILHSRHFITTDDDPVVLQSLYTINRYEVQESIETALMRGQIVICDRYLGSGLVYGLVNGMDYRWYESICHSLLKPDITLVLDITDEEYERRCKNYDFLDAFEEKKDFMKKVRQTYRDVATNQGWHVINAEGEVGEIANEIYSLVREHMDNFLERGEDE